MEFRKLDRELMEKHSHLAKSENYKYNYKDHQLKSVSLGKLQLSSRSHKGKEFGFSSGSFSRRMVEQIDIFDVYFNETKNILSACLKGKSQLELMGNTSNESLCRYVALNLSKTFADSQDSEREEILLLLSTQLLGFEKGKKTIKTLLRNTIRFYEDHFLKELSKKLPTYASLNLLDLKELTLREKIQLVEFNVPSSYGQKNSKEQNREWVIMYFLLRAGLTSECLEYCSANVMGAEGKIFKEALKEHLSSESVSESIRNGCFEIIKKLENENSKNIYMKGCFAVLAKLKTNTDNLFISNFHDFVWYQLSLVDESKPNESKNNSLTLTDLQNTIKSLGPNYFEQSIDNTILELKIYFSFLLFADGLNKVNNNTDLSVDLMNIAVILYHADLLVNIESGKQIKNESHEIMSRFINKTISRYMTDKTLELILFTQACLGNVKLSAEILIKSKRFDAVLDPKFGRIKLTNSSSLTLEDIFAEKKFGEFLDLIIKQSITSFESDSLSNLIQVCLIHKVQS